MKTQSTWTALMAVFRKAALLALAVSTLLGLPATASAQPEPGAVTVELPSAETWEELHDLRTFFDAWYRIEMSGDFGQIAKSAARTLLLMREAERRNVTDAQVTNSPNLRAQIEQSVDLVLEEDLGNTYESLFKVVRTEGDEIPQETQNLFLGWANALGCKGKEASDACQSLANKLAAMYDAKRPKATGFTAGADSLREEGMKYRGINRIVLLTWALLELNRTLPEADRFWQVTGKDSSSIIGRNLCICHEGGKVTCGTVGSMDNESMTIDGERVTFLQMAQGNERLCEAGAGGPAGLSLSLESNILVGLEKTAYNRPTFLNTLVFGNYEFGSGLGLRLGFGVGAVLKGGIAPHYTEIRDNELYPLADVGAYFAFPLPNNRFRLKVGMDYISTFNEGAGSLLGSFGAQWLLSEHFSLGAQAVGGAFNSGIIRGDHPTSPLENPPLNQWVIGGGLGAAWTF